MNKASIRALLMAAILLVGLMATASPALADLDAGAGAIIKKPVIGETDGSDNDGDADSDSGTSYDEDSDTNDGTANNVEDDGDNAHPSGKDRSVENGGSGTQGKAESNPDDSKGPQRYEGARGDDKANGPGGKDLADQDGNNGCGNDDDFDDDNNGWCGKSGPDNSCSKSGHSGWECSEGDADVEGNNETCPDGSNMGNGNGKNCDAGGGSDVEGDEETCPKDSSMGNGHSSDDCDTDVEGSDDEAASGGPAGKITICHATGSATNPFVEITIDENGLSGHGDHEGDIIPMPAGGCAEDDDAVLGRTDNVCPAGTDNAGKPMNDGACNEDNSVLGKVLQKSGVLGTAVKKASSALGAVLPFTGNGDVMAFLVLALGLIAGGVFLLLKRKKKATV